ncbi:hypothetical protein D3C87_1283090 [compost metagenome]
MCRISWIVQIKSKRYNLSVHRLLSSFPQLIFLITAILRKINSSYDMMIYHSTIMIPFKISDYVIRVIFTMTIKKTHIHDRIFRSISKCIQRPVFIDILFIH